MSWYSDGEKTPSAWHLINSGDADPEDFGYDDEQRIGIWKVFKHKAICTNCGHVEETDKYFNRLPAYCPNCWYSGFEDEEPEKNCVNCSLCGDGCPGLVIGENYDCIYWIKKKV